MKKISYSAWKKYHQCPQLYKYHYIDRLRPMGKGSPLAFGIAMDDALNALLLKEDDPLKVFRDSFKFEDLEDVEWDNRDYDEDLFTGEQLDELAGKPWGYKCWASMRIKGRLLIEAYEKIIYPMVQDVKSVQKEIDGGPGILDAELILDGVGEVLVDHKTSSRPYQNDAVLFDSQLALYCSRQNVDKAAFIVLVKAIAKEKVCKKCKSVYNKGRGHRTCDKMVKGKRCHGPFEVTPIAKVQLIVDDIPERNKELIEKSIIDTEACIEAGHFPRNLTACKFMYGKPCPYFKKCWYDDETGLQYKPEEKKDGKK